VQQVLSLPIDEVTFSRILFSVLFALVLWIIVRQLRKAIASRVEDPHIRYGLSYSVTYAALALALTVLGIVWLQRLGGFSVALGIFAAGFAFSAQQIVASFAGWLLITTGRAFDVGDRIEMGGIRGDVIGFGILRTSMMEIGNWVEGDQNTGRIVTISNAAVFQQPLYNYTRYFHFIWDELHVPVTYTSNWRKAREICLEHAKQHSEPSLEEAKAELVHLARQYIVAPAEVAPSIYLTFNDNWIDLAVRYLTPVRRRRQIKDALSRDLLTAFEERTDITVASQTVTIGGALGIEPDKRPH